MCAGTSTGNASGTSTSAIPRSLRIRSAHNPGHATERYLFAYALRVIYFNTITKSQLTIIPFIRSWQRLRKFSHDFDFANDVTIEFREVFGRHPIFSICLAAN